MVKKKKKKKESLTGSVAPRYRESLMVTGRIGTKLDLLALTSFMTPEILEVGMSGSGMVENRRLRKVARRIFIQGSDTDADARDVYSERLYTNAPTCGRPDPKDLKHGDNPLGKRAARLLS